MAAIFFGVIPTYGVLPYAMISCLIQLVLNSPLVTPIVKDVLFTGIYIALSCFWLFKIHHDSQIKILHTIICIKTGSNKVVCSLEQGVLLSVKQSLHGHVHLTVSYSPGGVFNQPACISVVNCTVVVSFFLQTGMAHALHLSCV